jgi:ribose transport system substrate-binding protein
MTYRWKNRAGLIASSCLIAATTAVAVWGPASSVAASAATKKTFVVGLASEGFNASFPLGVIKGLKKVAGVDHVKTIILNGNLTESTQEANIQTLIADHVNGIVIDVIDAGPTAAMVKLANAAKIPVMLVHGYAGTNYPPPVLKGVAYDIDENEVEAGKEAGQLALQADPNGGDVAIIEGTAGYQAVTQRADGFTSVINPTGKFTVVATQPGGWTDTLGDQACASILQAHPTISLFFAESDDMAAGCVTAIQAAKSTAKVIGLGGEQVFKPMIENGTAYGTVCYLPVTEGETVMKAMYAQLTGKAHYNRTMVFYKTPPVTLANINSCGFQW